MGGMNMFYKIEENEIKMCPQNGKLSDGTAISNLPKYFEKNTDIAAQNGYYPLEEKEDETREFVGYTVKDGVICGIYENEGK